MQLISPVFPGRGFEEIKIAENQSEYMTLPVVEVFPGTIVSRWEMDEAERKIVLQTGELYVCLLTFGKPAPTTLFQVENPIFPDSPEKFLKPKTQYFGSGLPVVAQDENSIWLLLKLTDEDRETAAAEGNVWFFMLTEGKPVTPSLIQVEAPEFEERIISGRELSFIAAPRWSEKRLDLSRRYGINPFEENCWICKAKVIIAESSFNQLQRQPGLKCVCLDCLNSQMESSEREFIIMPEAVEELKRAVLLKSANPN